MGVVQLVENRVLESARNEALARIRDADDGPALALGLQLECAIWTTAWNHRRSHQNSELPIRAQGSGLRKRPARRTASTTAAMP